MSNPTIVTTECGHTWSGNPSHHTIRVLGEATTDCRVCFALLLIDSKQWDGMDRDQVPETMHCVNFHKEMNRRDSRWPADGSGTGYVEFGEEK